MMKTALTSPVNKAYVSEVAIRYLDNLKNNKEALLLAIEHYPQVLYFASNDMRNDQELAMASVMSGGGYALKAVGESARHDPMVIKSVLFHDMMKVAAEELDVEIKDLDEQTLSWAKEEVENKNLEYYERYFNQAIEEKCFYYYDKIINYFEDFRDNFKEYFPEIDGRGYS